jgi:hypothetical protein
MYPRTENKKTFVFKRPSGLSPEDRNSPRLYTRSLMVYSIAIDMYRIITRIVFRKALNSNN